MNTARVGEITTSRKSVVSHSRQQIPKGRDETGCPATAGRFRHNRKNGSSFVLSFNHEILWLAPKREKCGLKYVI